MKRFITTVALTFSAYYIVQQFNLTQPTYCILVGWIACTLNDILNQK